MTMLTMSDMREMHGGYALFDRAITEHDAQAWGGIFTLYRPLMIRWLRSRAESLPEGETTEGIINQALVRFCSAMTAERFKTFPDISSLLSYLRTCVSA